MTDLVQRLRSFTSGPHADIARDAADEITRLRAELGAIAATDSMAARNVESLQAEIAHQTSYIKQLNADAERWALDADTLEADNTKLREALRKCAIKESLYGGYHKCCTACLATWITDEPERHAPGCLAAPKEGER